MEFDIFLSAPPGLEQVLAAEARDAGFAAPTVSPGGVTIRGDWAEVWRANLTLRGTGRVLARIGAFRSMHLAQLDKRARRFDWAAFLRPDTPFRVEATCSASRIYHERAAAQRIARAITETLGAPLATEAGDASALLVRARIDDDLCTLSVDTSGQPLHRRGTKTATGKAPMRETLAALFLREAGYAGTQTVIDPMCGSGTFVLEAAEIACALLPGRTRSFAFERLASFDKAAWDRMRNVETRTDISLSFFGYDRDDGAIANARANAERADVSGVTSFSRQAISDLVPPDAPPGLVIVNPPYGGRIGNKKLLYGLYATLGQVLRSRFRGWRVSLITSEAGLARATTLPFLPPAPPVPHGGLKIRHYRTAPLA